LVYAQSTARQLKKKAFHPLWLKYRPSNGVVGSRINEEGTQITLIGFIHIFTLQKKYSPKRRGATLPLPPQLLPLISSVLFRLNWLVYINQERKTKRALHNVSLHTVKERDYCSKIKRQSKAKMRSWRKKRSRRPSTFYGSPLCLPTQKPPAVDLVLLVTAHHSKRDHLLQDRKNRDRQEEQRDIP
jgi:hypothetical protein